MGRLHRLGNGCVAAFHQRRLVTPAEEVPPQVMAVVEAARVGGLHQRMPATKLGSGVSSSRWEWLPISTHACTRQPVRAQAWPKASRNERRSKSSRKMASRRSPRAMTWEKAPENSRRSWRGVAADSDDRRKCQEFYPDPFSGSGRSRPCKRACERRRRRPVRRSSVGLGGRAWKKRVRLGELPAKKLEERRSGGAIRPLHWLPRPRPAAPQRPPGSKRTAGASEARGRARREERASTRPAPGEGRARPALLLEAGGARCA